MSKIEFKFGGNSIEVNPPQYGYNSEIHLSMHRAPDMSDGEVHWYDNGSEYDWRVFNCPLILNEQEQYDLQDFFKDDDKGRAKAIQMKVPAGIYPFGPDLGGGVRRFQVRLLNNVFSGARQSPYITFHSNLSFLLVSAPSYSVPSISYEVRNLQIGTVSGLRHPPGWINPSTRYGVQTIVTYGGGRPLNKSENADIYRTEFDLEDTINKTANLLRYFQNTARSNTFTIKAQKNSFLFGRDNSSIHDDDAGAGSYVVTLDDNIVTTIHTRKDLFKTKIKMAYRSHSGL